MNWTKLEQETAQEEPHGWVEAKDLTPEELRASLLADVHIVSIWVRFTSEAGKHYKALHIYDGKPTSIPQLIFLIQEEKDKPDFQDVQEIVANETGGLPKYISDRGTDICAMIELEHKPTQSRVADYVERIYIKHFTDVTTEAYFRNVPKSAYENSGLPLEKLTFKQN